MSTIQKNLLGSQTTLLSTGLNSLANNGLVLSASFNNTIGQTGDGYLLADFELVLAAPGGTLTAYKAASIWFIQSQDGTNYADGDASTEPARRPDFVIPLRASSGAQRETRYGIELPPGLFKVLLKNDGTGQTWGASGSTLKIRPYTPSLEESA